MRMMTSGLPYATSILQKCHSKCSHPSMCLKLMESSPWDRHPYTRPHQEINLMPVSGNQSLLVR